MNDNENVFYDWEKYQLEELLGQGSYGQVYKATDQKLKRIVALKILNSSPDEKTEKFRNEARNQAMVDHPNICKVYEVGSFKNRYYISMQFIEGDTLNHFSKQLNLIEKIKIFKKVANGLHAAHLTGLIHRDVKPTNILIKKKADGKYIPYITDFGIAKQLDSPALTKDHLTTGSPNYMSPEQAAGDKYKALDIRTDIYSLGVTIYELLSGKLPHTGEMSIEVMFKIINKDPEHICKVSPATPKDLGAIVMKCLEKDPEKRYESAKELADDLDRFLQGNPVKARPSGIFYKTFKKITKYPVISTLMTLSTILIFMLLGFWTSEKVQNSKKIEIGQQMGQMINNSENIMRISHMMPLHNIESDMEKVKKEIIKIEKLMSKMGNIGKGPGFYAIGKCYSILNDQNKAQKYFEKSMELKYLNDDLFYQLGFIYGNIYKEKCEKLNESLNKKTFEIQREELKKEYLNKALKMFEKSKENGSHLKYYGEAFLCFIKQDYQNTLKNCEKAIEVSNWFYEAILLNGQTHLYLAEKMGFAGNFQEAEIEYELAKKHFLKAIAIAQSDPNCHKLLALLWIKRFTNLRNSTKQLPLYRNNALEELKKAEQINPNDPNLSVVFAQFYWHWAEYLMESGKDLAEYIEIGIKYGKKAIELNKNNYEAYHHLGNCYLYEGINQMYLGENPEKSFNKALYNYNKSIKIANSFILNYTNVGVIYAYLGQYLYLHGFDPIETLEKGVDHFLKAEKIDPNNLFIYSNLGGIFYLAGNYLFDIGKNPLDYYEKANDCYGNALNLSPADNSLYVNLSGTCISIAEYGLKLGENPTKNLNKAIKYAKKSIELYSKNSFGFLNLTSAYLAFAKYKININESPIEYLDLAVKNCKTSIELTPNSVDALESMGAVYFEYANYFIMKNFENRETSIMLQHAENTIKKAIGIDSEYSSLYLLLSKIYMGRASLTTNKSEIKNFYKLSLDSINNAIRLAPKTATNYEIASDILVKLSKFDSNKNIKLIKALEYIDKSLKTDPESKQFAKTKEEILKLISGEK